MEEERRIKMEENESKDQVPQQLAEQISGATGGDASSIQGKLEEAMAQGQESGLLSSESLQDGSTQDKIKEVIEKGQAPGGFLNRLMGGEVKNPLSSYGNNFGNAIEDKLSPVGNVAGKGLEQVGRPVGGIVDPLLGGVMRSGAAFGETLGVGSGNMDKKKEEAAAEREHMKKEVGGKEQTGDNPLGL